MSRIVVSHAYGATRASVWYPYLAGRLGALGHEVEIPQLPNDDLRPAAWCDSLAKSARAGAAMDTVLVGHSIGGVAVLRLLERHDVSVDGAFAGIVLVSTPARAVGYDALDQFFTTPFDWARIRRAAGQFRVLAAVDDPVNVPDPVVHVKELVVGLTATAVLTPTGGHFGATPDDHMDLPEAVDLALNCLSAAGRA